MKLLFLFVILIGLLNPCFSLWSSSTSVSTFELSKPSEYDGHKFEDECIKVAKSDLQSSADLLFARIQTELEKLAVKVDANSLKVDTYFSKLDGEFSQLKERITKTETTFVTVLKTVVDDSWERHSAREVVLLQVEDTFLQLKEEVISVGETINSSSSRVKSLQEESLSFSEDFKTLATLVVGIHSNLEPFQKTLTNVDANVVKLSNAFTAGANVTHSLLLKVLKEAAHVWKSEERLSLLEQRVTNLHAITHGLSSNVTSESQKLKEFIYLHGKCFLSRNLNMALLSNGQQYYSNSTQRQQPWLEVKEFCDQHGMTMVTLDTEEEFNVVSSHFREKPYWVSANDIGREPGKFHWTNGVEVDSSKRRNNNDFGQGKDSCLFIVANKLYDQKCEGNTYPLCKRPAYCKIN